MTATQLIQSAPAVQAPSTSAQGMERPAACTRIDVVAAQTCLVEAEHGKQKRQYSFDLQVDGVVVHSIKGRYSDLRKRCQPAFRNLPDCQNGALANGDFPSRHGCTCMQDYTLREDYVARRAEELQLYFQCLLNLPDEGRILRSPTILTALDATTAAVEALASVAAARLRLAEDRRAAKAAQQKLLKQEQRDDCRHAQEFNRAVAYSNAPAGTFTSINFPRKQVFNLQNGWWTNKWTTHEAGIMGPGGHQWFKVSRITFGFDAMGQNDQFAITNMSGEPLLLLKEQFSWTSYEYNLFRIDPCQPAEPIHACRIVREWSPITFINLLNNQFDIELTAATQHHGRIQCQGSWPSQFTLYNKDGVQATVTKEFGVFADRYEVTIMPNVDCLLFVGIACAIDRIHEEVRRR